MSHFTPVTTAPTADIRDMNTPKENNMSPSNAPSSPSKRLMLDTPKNTFAPVINDQSIEFDATLNDPNVAEPISEDSAENEGDRLAKELAESESLARMLMAEEAEQSFALQYEMLQSATADMDGADLVAVQALLRADEEVQAAMVNAQQQREVGEEGEEGSEPEEGDEGDEDDGNTYDELIELGRNIGDVKAERWAFKAQAVIDALPKCTHCKPENGKESAYDEPMCIFCRDDYSEGDVVRILPCKHAFHAECVDEWLRTNNSCPMCKRAVAEESDEEGGEENETRT